MDFKLYGVIFHGNKWIIGVIGKKRSLYWDFFLLCEKKKTFWIGRTKTNFKPYFCKVWFSNYSHQCLQHYSLRKTIFFLDKSVFFDSTQNSTHLCSVTIWNRWTLSVGFAFAGIDKHSHLNTIFKIWTYYNIK